MAHDVFISYSTKDKPSADAVCAALEAKRIRCWIAPRDVPPGRDYAETLIEAIRGARVVVLVFSSNSNSSSHVMREVERAASTGIPILPFRIEDVPLSASMEYYISSTHWLDALTPPLERHLGKLAASVQALLSVGEEEPAGSALTVVEEPARRQWSLPKWSIALLALVAVVVVGVGTWFAVTRSGSATVGQEGTSTAADAAATTKATITSTTVSSPTTTIEGGASTAHFDWHQNPTTGHYYALTGTGMTWNMLESLAVQTGGHLVSINDAAEEEWLYSTFGSTMFWIGLTDYPDEGTYRWTSGEPVTYLNWLPGEPTDIAGGAGTEDAVHAIPWARGWNDEPTWITEFWDPDNQENIPSYPGVIEVENLP